MTVTRAPIETNMAIMSTYQKLRTADMEREGKDRAMRLELLDKANVVIEKRFTSYLNKREKENSFSKEIALLVTVKWSIT